MAEYCKCCGRKYNDVRSPLANSCAHHPDAPIAALAQCREKRCADAVKTEVARG